MSAIRLFSGSESDDDEIPLFHPSKFNPSEQSDGELLTEEDLEEFDFEAQLEDILSIGED